MTEEIAAQLAERSQLARELARKIRIWTIAIQAVGLTLGIGGVAIGLVLALGQDSRTSGASFAYIRESFPGGPEGLGLLWLATGAVLIVGTLLREVKPWSWLRVVGHIAQGFTAATFGFTLLLAALEDPKASLTGIPIYLSIATIHAIYALSVIDFERAGPSLTD